MIWKNEPFYLKATLCLIGLSLTGFLIFIGQDIIVPIAFSMLLAVLLLPFNNWMERIKVPRVLSIFISIVLALIIIGGIIYFLSVQIANFTDDWPAIKHRWAVHVHNLRSWVRRSLHISSWQQNAYIDSATEQLKGSSTDYIQQTILTLTDLLVLLVLIPIYTFLLLYYRRMIRSFFMTVFKEEHGEHVKYVLNQSKSIVQNYMLGLMIEMAIVALLNAIGFMVIGIKYAIFLAVLAAILNLIPYIGMLVATVFCMLITLTNSSQISPVLWVGLVLTIVQFIDNNILMPRIVGNKVRINSLITIIAVIVGGALSGFSGMFLAIPFVAILKTIFDRVEGLQPWGMLLGDDVTGTAPKDVDQQKIVDATTSGSGDIV